MKVFARRPHSKTPPHVAILKHFLFIFGLLGTIPALAAAAQTVSKADTLWVMLSTQWVILMTLPGLALLYGGMLRSKNVLSILTQALAVFSLVGLLWFLYGYSLAFSSGSTAFIGGLSKALFSGITYESLVGTFSKGVYIPEYVYAAFQMSFAGITCAIILGAFAERVRFGAVLAFIAIWFTFAYLPIAHMVWFWAGPDAYGPGIDPASTGIIAGFLFNHGALDFAGGTVVHINSAVAGLVGAAWIGPRLRYQRVAMPPHNLPLVMLGGCLLWVGWFGFNAGSNLEVSTFATLPFINTLLATCAATVTWMTVEWIVYARPSTLGAISGALAGLVSITPGCGFVGPLGSVCIGFIGALAGLWGIHCLKRLLKVDDALDVFGIHGVCGIVGALLTAIFANPLLGGTGVYDYTTDTVSTYDTVAQLLAQLYGIGLTAGLSALVSILALWIIGKVTPLRVSTDDEVGGLNVSTHGEKAYNLS